MQKQKAFITDGSVNRSTRDYSHWVIRQADGEVLALQAGLVKLAGYRALAYEAITKNPKSTALNGIAHDLATDKLYITGKGGLTSVESLFLLDREHNSS